MVRREPLDDAPGLQAHEHEGEHVNNEDGSLPYRIGADAQPRFQAPRCCASQRHGVDHDGDDGREHETFGYNPNTKRGDELQHRARRCIAHLRGDEQIEASQQVTGEQASHRCKQEEWSIA